MIISALFPVSGHGPTLVTKSVSFSTSLIYLCVYQPDCNTNKNYFWAPKNDKAYIPMKNIPYDLIQKGKLLLKQLYKVLNS